MNRKETELKRRESLRSLEFRDRCHINCLRFSTGESFLHSYAKFLVCWKLKGGFVDKSALLETDVILDSIEGLEKDDFVTESRSLDRRRRFDIKALTTYDYEIVLSSDPPLAKNERRMTIRL